MTKKLTYALMAFFVACISSLCIFSIQANEKSDLVVTVKQAGSVEVIIDDRSYVVDVDHPLEISVVLDSTVRFMPTGELVSVTRNENTVELDANQPIELVSGLDRWKFDFDVNIDRTKMFPSQETLDIISSYQQGKENSQANRDARYETAKRAGLLDYVDEDYFINAAFYTKYHFSNLLYDDLQILDRINTPAYQQDALSMLEMPKLRRMITPFNMDTGNKKIIDYASFQYNNPAGGSVINGLWRLEDNTLAFCAQGYAAPPVVGDTYQPAVQVDDVELRKVLYYGYGGPGDILTSRYGTAGAIVITDDLVSYAYTGSSIGTNIFNGYHWNTSFQYIWQEIMLKDDPANYEAYTVKVNGSGFNYDNVWTNKQVLTYGKYEPKGSVQIQKSSALSALTNNNGLYSLQGAQYGLYSDANCTNLVGTFTIQKNGWSNEITDLSEQTYYFKEIKAAAGYILDPTVHSISVRSGQKATQTVSDTPQSHAFDLLVKKVNDLSQPLENVTFKVKYVNAIVDQQTMKTITPTRSWILKSDKDGNVCFDDAHKVSGDGFYKNSLNQNVLPLGTLYIEEHEAIDGYVKSNDSIYLTINAQGTQENISIYQARTFVNRPMILRILKEQMITRHKIENTKFKHTDPAGVSQTVSTDANGFIELRALKEGRHTIQEIDSADGYVNTNRSITFEVKANGTFEVISQLSDGMVALNDQDQILTITIQNEVMPYCLRIFKKNNEGLSLDGAIFGLYSDVSCTNEIDRQTSKNGNLIFEGLKDRTTYYLKEIKAPIGYRVLVDDKGDPVVHSIQVLATPDEDLFNVSWNQKEYTKENSQEAGVRVSGSKDDRMITIEVINQLGLKLPKTGSQGNLAGLMAVIVSVFGVLIMKRKGR